MAQRFDTFEDFWPYYVRAHSKKSTRLLHLLGTSAAVTSAATGLVTGRLAYLLAAPVIGYAPAWFAHFVFEGNVPATFGHPLWSLKADFVMMSKMVCGTMDAEVERVMAAHQKKSNGAAAEPPAGISVDRMPPINVTHGPSGAAN
jgi:hypothetical protein